MEKLSALDISNKGKFVLLESNITCSLLEETDELKAKDKIRSVKSVTVN